MANKEVSFQEHVLKELDGFERVQFIFFYRQYCKKNGIAYLWLLFLGIFGLHKFYLNRRVGWLYLFFAVTLIPVIFVIIDVFLLYFQVKKHNKRLSITIFELIRKYSQESGTQLLIINRKLRAKAIHSFELILVFVAICGVIIPAIFYTSMRLTAHQLEIHYKTNYLDGHQSDSYIII